MILNDEKLDEDTKQDDLQRAFQYASSSNALENNVLTDKDQEKMMDIMSNENLDGTSISTLVKKFNNNKQIYQEGEKLNGKSR